jgi:hypothetical protein
MKTKVSGLVGALIKSSWPPATADPEDAIKAHPKLAASATLQFFHICFSLSVLS